LNYQPLTKKGRNKIKGSLGMVIKQAGTEIQLLSLIIYIFYYKKENGMLIIKQVKMSGIIHRPNRYKIG
jgi:hypothetical protein